MITIVNLHVMEAKQGNVHTIGLSHHPVLSRTLWIVFSCRVLWRRLLSAVI